MRQRFSILVSVDDSELDTATALAAANVQNLMDHAFPYHLTGTVKVLLVSKQEGGPSSVLTDG